MKRLARALVGLTFLGGSAVASAHQGHPVLRAERTLKFEADGEEGMRMVVTVNYGTEEMLRVARRADANGDGTLDRREIEDTMLDWADTLRRELPLRLDGSFARVDFVEPFFEPRGRIELRPGTLEMTGIIRMPAGRHELFVTDDMPGDQFERTDVMFTATNGARLLASGPTEVPTEVMPSFAYGRNTERRRVNSIGLHVEMPQPREGALPSPRSIGYHRPLAFILLQTMIAVLLGRVLRAIRERDRLAKHRH